MSSSTRIRRSDGCGGACGECSDATEICSGGQCIAPPTACEAAGEVACGAELSNLTFSDAGVTKAFSKYTCQKYASDNYETSAELTYSFVPTEDAIVTIEKQGPYAIDVTVLKDGGNGCEDTTDTCVDQGSSKLVFNATAGQPYYLVWDSFSSAAQNPFGFTVSCCTPQCTAGECGGDNGCGGTCGCEASEVCISGLCQGVGTQCTEIDTVACNQSLTTLSNTMAGVTKAFGSYTCQSYPSDDFSTSPEVTYAFASDKDYIVTVKEEGFTSMSVTVLKEVGNGCEDTEQTCITQSTSSAEFSANAGDIFYIVWDSYSKTPVDDFGFSVNCCEPDCTNKACDEDNGCGTPCGCADAALQCIVAQCIDPATIDGNTCSSAFAITSLPYEDSKDSATFTNNYSTKSSCGSVSDSGDDEPDAVYSFTPTDSGVYHVTMPGFASGDPSLVYISTDCADFSTACTAYKDFWNSPDPLVLDAVGGTTYYIFIDSLYTSEIGTYHVKVDGPITP